jgi:predicted acylesterase/phospholipase RssA
MDGDREHQEELPYERLMDWLASQEPHPDLVILQCEPGQPSWLDFCLRQADRTVVLMGDDELRTPGGGVEWWHNARLAERSPHLELAVVHARSDRLPRGGAAYAELPGASRVHHVRVGDPEDAASLARWVFDRPVGLVLGGGGALGIAHVGVLKALEEAHVPVDVVGGTSMGAIFAGGKARGWSADTIMDHVRSLFSSRLALYDPTIPIHSLLAGKKLDRVMDALFEDIDIADVWTPFFCVSTNISRADSQVHDRGSLRDAIRSSCSIPGLFPPFEVLRQLLVDGGLVNNLPLDVMASVCRGPIVAVDVFPYQRHQGPRTNGTWRERTVQGLVGALRKLKSRPISGPLLFEVLMHATLAGSQHTTMHALSTHPPALHLVPDLGSFGLLDWRAYEAIFQAGYDCAKRELDAGALPRGLWEGRIVTDAPS